METTHNSVKVKLGIKVMKLVESLIGREVTVGQALNCNHVYQVFRWLLTLTYSIYHMRSVIRTNPLIWIIQFDMREFISLSVMFYA